MDNIGEESMNEERKGGKAQLRRAEEDIGTLALPRYVGSFFRPRLPSVKQLPSEHSQLSTSNENLPSVVISHFS
jgi:hypothetical protein